VPRYNIRKYCQNVYYNCVVIKIQPIIRTFVRWR